MDNYNFNNKTFVLLENSENGKVNSDTVFKYKQEGNIVTADYSGGTVIYGKIIAVLKGDVLDMLYQCVTTDNELKAGKAIAECGRDGDAAETERAAVEATTAVASNTPARTLAALRAARAAVQCRDLGRHVHLFARHTAQLYQ